MKAYTPVKIEIISVDEKDVITSSPGINTTITEEKDGIWDLNIQQ